MGENEMRAWAVLDYVGRIYTVIVDNIDHSDEEIPELSLVYVPVAIHYDAALSPETGR